MKHDKLTYLYLKNLFFTSEGRLNRQPFNIILLGAIIIPSFIEKIFSSHTLDLFISIIVFVLTVCPIIKRLHDRDYSGWWYAGLASIPIGVMIFIIITIPYMMPLVCPEGTCSPTPPPFDHFSTKDQLFLGSLGAVFSCGILATLAGAIWLTIQTSFLRGTKGSNEYGPDPLENSSP